MNIDTLEQNPKIHEARKRQNWKDKPSLAIILRIFNIPLSVVMESDKKNQQRYRRIPTNLT